MVPLNPVATLPRASSARSFTAGVICWPATVVPGCVPNTSWVAGPAMILNELLVAVPIPVAGRQYTGGLWAWSSSVRASALPTAATVVVPPSVLPPGLLPSATVTLPVNVGTRLPAGSSAVTWTAGLIAAPATVFDGCTVKASWVAVPGVMSNAVLVTGADRTGTRLN